MDVSTTREDFKTVWSGLGANSAKEDSELKTEYCEICFPDNSDVDLIAPDPDLLEAETSNRAPELTETPEEETPESTGLYWSEFVAKMPTTSAEQISGDPFNQQNGSGRSISKFLAAEEADSPDLRNSDVRALDTLNHSKTKSTMTEDLRKVHVPPDVLSSVSGKNQRFEIERRFEQFVGSEQTKRSVVVEPAVESARSSDSTLAERALPNFETTTRPAVAEFDSKMALQDRVMSADQLTPLFTDSVGDTAPVSTAARPTPTSIGGAVMAQPVAQQIAVATLRSNGASAEISLHPEELGRVRISLTPADTGMTVSIVSERPETGELIRRHLDVLETEFTNLGFENLTFSFGDDDSPSSDRGNDDLQTFSPTMDTTLDPPPPKNTVLSLSGGLDLKL